jgi:hypothetical protein
LRLKDAEPKARHYYDRHTAIVRDQQKKKEGGPRRTESPGNLLALRMTCRQKKKMLGKEEQWPDQYCWGRAIMPIKAPQTIEDEQPTANRSPCRLDASTSLRAARQGFCPIRTQPDALTLSQ